MSISRTKSFTPYSLSMPENGGGAGVALSVFAGKSWSGSIKYKVSRTTRSAGANDNDSLGALTRSVGANDSLGGGPERRSLTLAVG